MGHTSTTPLFQVQFSCWTLSIDYRRFQAHVDFVIVAFDISRRQHTITQSTIQTRSHDWANTAELLESLTPEQLFQAASQAERYEPITNPAVKSLLRAVSKVGSNVLGSDAKKYHMFSQLKSSIVRHGFPVIYLTLNPGEKFSPLALHYAGEEINLTSFRPEMYPLSERIATMLRNPLSVVQYFHSTVQTIIKCFIKSGIFGSVTHHYGTIEYQGRGTPHIHMLVSS